MPRNYSIEESVTFVDLFDLAPTSSGPLDGLAFAIKDLIDVAGRVTTCGNPTWRDTHPPAAANAVCVDQLLAAGARATGSVVCDELAFSLIGENAFYGTPLNPKAPDRVPGGSSSGSASAVACGLVDFALGTDTGGSVRVPASNCGIYGFRPSHGLISVAGVMPFAPGYDTVGVLARDARVLAGVLRVLLGSGDEAQPEPDAILLLREAWEVADPEVRDSLDSAVQSLRATNGDRVRETSLNDIDPGSNLPSWWRTYSVVQWAEIWSTLGPWVQSAQPEFGPRTHAGFELTRTLDRTLVQDATVARERQCRGLQRLLSPHTLLCMPTVHAPAPLKNTVGGDRRTGSYYPNALALTSIAGNGRLPQVSIPLGEVNGAPIGLSLLAAYGQDDFLLETVLRGFAS